MNSVNPKRLSFVALVWLFSTSNHQCSAQDQNIENHHVTLRTPEIALVDIEAFSGKDVTLVLGAPTDAGNTAVVSGATNNSLWLNYTSVVNKGRKSNDKSRKILVKISQGSVPPGIQLKLIVDPATNYGKGTKGIPMNQINLSNIDQQIIHNIGSCYTGQGVGKGHRLVYSLAVITNSFALLDNNKNNSELTITYTITDN